MRNKVIIWVLIIIVILLLGVKFIMSRSKLSSDNDNSNNSSTVVSSEELVSENLEPNEVSKKLKDKSEELGVIFSEILKANSEEVVTVMKNKLKENCTESEYIQLNETINYNEKGTIPEVNYEVYFGNTETVEGPYNKVLILLESTYEVNDNKMTDEMVIQLSLDDDLKICKHSIKQI